MTGGTSLPHRGAVRRVLFRLLIGVAVVWSAHVALTWATGQVEAGGLSMRYGVLAVLLIVYAVLIAVPFVPGIEIAMALMAIEGPSFAPLIYFATLSGLSLAYCVGEWVPYPKLTRVFEDLRMQRISLLLHKVQPMDRTTRLNLLRDRAPRVLRPFVSRFRYIVLALLINLPGNAVIGGGGGILFIAGFSRLFSPLITFFTLALAVAPIPLLVWVFDIDALHWFR